MTTMIVMMTVRTGVPTAAALLLIPKTTDTASLRAVPVG